MLGTIQTVNLDVIIHSKIIYLVLEIGNNVLTDTEGVSHFSLWAIAKAPLIIGCDVSNMSATTLSTLTNREVIAVNQDSLGIQGKRIASMSAPLRNASGEVMIANCSSSNIDPTRRQWIYNISDGSIRSVFNGRCLSIDQCRTGRIDFVILNDCQIDAPQTKCQGKNQQWSIDLKNETILSQMDASW